MDNVLFFPKDTDENKVTVSAGVNKEITEKYAPERVKNSSFYARRRGGFPPTLFDCWYYKCAEFASANFLHKKHNLPLVEPDVKIYKSSEKSWDADISYENVVFLNKHFKKLRFHSKSVTRKVISKGYPESFMFQFANKDATGGHDDLFETGNESDYCVLVYVPYDTITTGRLDFYIRGVLPWSFIKENNLFENPKKKELIGVKLCVYTESIRKHFNQNRMKN